MSTHAYIGIEKDGMVQYIYVHSDGFLNGVGKILLNYYRSYDIVEELISNGDCSTLGCSIGYQHNFNSDERRKKNKDGLTEITTFYRRDRGEWDSRPAITTHHDFTREGAYCYLFSRTHGWQIWKHGVPVTDFSECRIGDRPFIHIAA